MRHVYAAYAHTQREKKRPIPKGWGLETTTSLISMHKTMEGAFDAGRRWAREYFDRSRKPWFTVQIYILEE